MTEKNNNGEHLVLSAFFPYRLAVFSDDVSRSMAQLYGGRFNLSRQEWRIVAALGERSGLTAKELAEYSTLDKTQVSRAGARLLREGLILRSEDREDRRHRRHRLSAKGRRVYREIVPLVMAREAYLLSALSRSESLELDRLINLVHQKALELQQWG